MLLYIQLLTFQTNEEAINLLHFPANPLLPSTFTLKAKRWSQGQSFSHNLQNVDKLIDVVTEKKANEVKIQYLFEPDYVPARDIIISKVTSLFTVSPVNIIWTTTNSYSALRRVDKRIRASFESREFSVKRRKQPYPSLLETFVEFQSNLSQEKIYSCFYELLFQSIDLNLIKNNLTGNAELYRDNEFTKFDLLSELAPYPRTYPLLENKFDDLHPILIGSSNLCQDFYISLKEYGKVKFTSLETSDRCLGIIQISKKIMREKNTKNIAQQYLVPKDSTTHHSSLELESGEFRIGRAKIIVSTAKKWQEDGEKGMLPNFPADMNPLHLILPKYCLTIGINPDEMIVKIVDDYMARQIEKEIDACFSELPRNISLDRRTFIAHESIWYKYGGYTEISFVKNKFFSNIDSNDC